MKRLLMILLLTITVSTMPMYRSLSLSTRPRIVTTLGRTSFASACRCTSGSTRARLKEDAKKNSIELAQQRADEQKQHDDLSDQEKRLKRIPHDLSSAKCEAALFGTVATVFSGAGGAVGYKWITSGPNKDIVDFVFDCLGFWCTGTYGTVGLVFGGFCIMALRERHCLKQEQSNLRVSIESLKNKLSGMRKE